MRLPCVELQEKLNHTLKTDSDKLFKGCVQYIFASLVSMSNREHL